MEGNRVDKILRPLGKNLRKVTPTQPLLCQALIEDLDFAEEKILLFGNIPVEKRTHMNFKIQLPSSTDLYSNPKYITYDEKLLLVPFPWLKDQTNTLCLVFFCIFYNSRHELFS